MCSVSSRRPSRRALHAGAVDCAASSPAACCLPRGVAPPTPSLLLPSQATSPLITPEDFQAGWKTMCNTGADSLVTAVRAHRFLWSVESSGVAVAKNYDPLRRPRRQDWNGELIEVTRLPPPAGPRSRLRL